jgi:hypothetical protein
MLPTTEAFQTLRRKNLPRYRELCLQYSRQLTQDGLLAVLIDSTIYQIAIPILQRPIAERLDEEIQLLLKSTEEFKFFV